MLYLGRGAATPDMGHALCFFSNPRCLFTHPKRSPHTPKDLPTSGISPTLRKVYVVSACILICLDGWLKPRADAQLLVHLALTSQAEELHFSAWSLAYLVYLLQGLSGLSLDLSLGLKVMCGKALPNSTCARLRRRLRSVGLSDRSLNGSLL